MYPFFLENLILPLGELFFGGGYRKTLKKCRTYDRYSEAEILKIQEDNLKRILQHAIAAVPFYRSISYDESLSPSENLKRFPVLTKDILRRNSGELVSETYAHSRLKKNFSSGSSGIQSFSYSTGEHQFYLQALNHHWYSWGGLKMGDRVLQFGISPERNLPKKLKDFFFRIQYENAFALGESDFERIYRDLKRKKIRFLIGYPSAINELAQYLIQSGRSHDFKSIITLGDKLFAHFETSFNRAFKNPKIIDTYGCAEGILMACRSDIPYYYIAAPHVYLEVADESGNEVEPGETGYVLATSFSNFAQPLLRYRLGDLAVKLPRDQYPENREFNYPLLQKIVGRETDVIKTPDGKTLTVHSFTGIFEYFPEIRQFQIVHTKPDTIQVYYITDTVFPLQKNSISEIENRIKNLTGGSLKILWKKTDRIAASPSGKPEIIKKGPGFKTGS